MEAKVITYIAKAGISMDEVRATMDYNVRMVYINFLSGLEPFQITQTGLKIEFWFISGGQSFSTEFDLACGNWIHKVRNET